MPSLNIKQLKVMSQTTGSLPNESCGYHTFKNALLSLMFKQGIINKQKFESLLQDKSLFEKIFTLIGPMSKSKTPGKNDLMLPEFIKLLNNDSNMQKIFAVIEKEHSDIQQEKLISLKLKQDGSEKMSVVNISTGIHHTEYGLTGMEEDLFNATTIVKLAKSHT